MTRTYQIRNAYGRVLETETRTSPMDPMDATNWFAGHPDATDIVLNGKVQYWRSGPHQMAELAADNDYDPTGWGPDTRRLG